MYIIPILLKNPVGNQTNAFKKKIPMENPACENLSPILPAVRFVVVTEPLPAAVTVTVVVLVVLLIVVVEGRDGGRSVLLVSHGAEIREERERDKFKIWELTKSLGDNSKLGAGSLRRSEDGMVENVPYSIIYFLNIDISDRC